MKGAFSTLNERYRDCFSLLRCFSLLVCLMEIGVSFKSIAVLMLSGLYCTLKVSYYRTFKTLSVWLFLLCFVFVMSCGKINVFIVDINTINHLSKSMKQTEFNWSNFNINSIDILTYGNSKLNGNNSNNYWLHRQKTIEQQRRNKNIWISKKIHSFFPAIKNHMANVIMKVGQSKSAIDLCDINTFIVWDITTSPIESIHPSITIFAYCISDICKCLMFRHFKRKWIKREIN